MKNQLEQLNIKATTARCEILNVLKNAKSPLNFNQILAKMKININKATFYRNMALFEQKGMVNKFESDDRKWYYELGLSDHAHFVCESCHAIVCTNLPFPKNVEGRQVTSAILKGRCKVCDV